MIVSLEGKITKKEITFIHLKNSCGTTNKINISLDTSSKLALEQDISLHIVQIIKEESNHLYGFFDEDEMKLFELSMSVTGVGPKSAIAICSTYSFQEFAIIIDSGDLAKVTKIPGIGPKSGKRILLDLSGKIVEDIPKENPIFLQAVQALETLGFKKTEIKNALKDENQDDISELIKIGLKKLKQF